MDLFDQASPFSERYPGFAGSLRELFRPPRALSLSEWAAAHAVLSSESAAEPGRWRAYPYQVGIMDAFTDRAIETITVMKSARVGWTKILNHAIAYAIAEDAAPILLVQPTQDDAKGYAKDELEPMLRDTPALRGLIAPEKYRSKANTTLKKTFPGGALTIVGSNSPRSFRRLTVKRVFFDEVDGYDVKGAGKGANSEGDHIRLGIRRSDTYADRKIALGSTPKRAGTSRIAASYAASDQRRFWVPCPECGDFATLKWSDFHWPEGHPEQIRWACPVCAAAVDHSAKREMVERGEWRAEAPFRGHAGFHIWAAYSYSPAAAWERLAAEWEEAKGVPTQAQVFINTVLGETYEDAGERPDEDSLRGRAVAEGWTEADAPEGVLLQTVGADVQGNRIEAERVGWGVGYESWSLEYRVFLGDPAQPAVWADFDAWLLETRPNATAIDSGGHHTQAVYDFCAPRFARRVYAIKGAGGEGRRVWPVKPTKTKNGRVNLFVVGVDAAKDAIYSWLRIVRPGPGYCHMPADREKEWYAGLTSEVVVVKHSKGFPVRQYQRRQAAQGLPAVANEPLDCRTYAYCALMSFGTINWRTIVSRITKRRQTVEKPQEPAPAVPKPAPSAPVSAPNRAEPQRFSGWAARPVRAGGWMKKW